MSFKKILTLTIVLAAITALMVSCNMGAYPGFKKTKTGVYYKIYKPESKIIIIPFLLIYAIFTIFETVFSYKIAKENS